MEKIDDLRQSEGRTEPTQEEHLYAICKAWQQSYTIATQGIICAAAAWECTTIGLWWANRLNGRAAIDATVFSITVVVMSYICRKKILQLFAKKFVEKSELIPLVRAIGEKGGEEYIRTTLGQFPAILPALTKISESTTPNSIY